MSNAAAETHELFFAQFPQRAATVRTAEGRQDTRMIPRVLDARQIDFGILGFFLRLVVRHHGLLDRRSLCEVIEQCRQAVQLHHVVNGDVIDSALRHGRKHGLCGILHDGNPAAPLDRQQP